MHRCTECWLPRPGPYAVVLTNRIKQQGESAEKVGAYLCQKHALAFVLTLAEQIDRLLGKQDELDD
jgi:hypothetical protein